MKTLFDNLPGLTLHARHDISNPWQIRDRGAAITVAIKTEAHQIAELIASEGWFFSIKEAPGGHLLEVNIDCHVMTADELRDALRSAFNEGVDYGRHY